MDRSRCVEALRSNLTTINANEIIKKEHLIFHNRIMLKNICLLGFITISVLTLVTSCSDPAAQAKKQKCDQLTKMIDTEQAPVLESKGTTLERSYTLMKQQSLNAEAEENKKKWREEFIMQCK